MSNYDDDRLTSLGLLFEAHAALVRTLGRNLEREVDLPLTWFEVLLRLARAPQGRMRMAELAGSVALSVSGASRLIDRMVDDGLVERQRCPSDRRGAFAAITAAGTARLERALPVHLAGIDAHLVRRLNSGELEAFTSALDKLRGGQPPCHGADQGKRSDHQRATTDM